MAMFSPQYSTDQKHDMEVGPVDSTEKYVETPNGRRRSICEDAVFGEVVEGGPNYRNVSDIVMNQIGIPV